MEPTSVWTLKTELRRGLDAREATRRARAALRTGEVGARVGAFYVADIMDRRVYKDLGSPTVKHFARHHLKVSEGTAFKLARIGRALWELPHLAAGLDEGKISWGVVDYVSRVATPETDRAWAEWSTRSTVDNAKQEVAKREKGDLPSDPARRRLHAPRQRVGADLTPTLHKRWALARAKLEAECGVAISDEEMMMEVSDIIMRTRPDGSVLGRTPVNDRAYLFHAWPRPEGGTELVARGGEGEDFVVDFKDLTLRAPRRLILSSAAPPTTAADIDLAVLDPENHGSLAPDAERDAPTSPELREEVLARDDHCCRHCGSTHNVTVHHRRWRSYGGKTNASNLLTLCESCHSLVHARLLVVLGEPTGELHFYDRRGQVIGRYDPLPAAVTTITEPWTPAPADPLVTLDTLPAELDADAWRRHEPLLKWNERQGELVLTPGFAAAADAAPVSDERPTVSVRLAELVGQAQVRERLAVTIAAARERGEPLAPQLLVGSSGLGKTTLAHAVAAELGVPITCLPAPHVRTPDALVRALTSLGSGGVLFVDEVHALPDRVAEVLHEALDAGTLTLPVRQGLRARSVRVRLAPFTLIGATTDPDRLAPALVSRLRVSRLDPYTAQELAEVVGKAAVKAGLELTACGAQALAAASRETPRRAVALFQVVRDEATVCGASTADGELVARALRREGIDATGLDGVDRSILDALERAGRPVSLATLAATLDVTEDTLRQIHEPHLVRRGLIRITPGGRVLGPSARPAVVLERSPVEADVFAA